MTPLKDKVRNALDEARMLVLCSQILLGFKLQSAFQPGFARLPPAAHAVMTLSLGLLLVTFALLLLPTPLHRIVERGEDTGWMHRATGLVTTSALVPFAGALALDLAVPLAQAFGVGAGIVAGAAIGGLALFLWYGLEFIRRRQGAMPMRTPDNEEKTALKDRIAQVLVEARIILPGAQAMLGFQLAAFFTDAFERLPVDARLVHVASTLWVAVTILLLMTPPAYHRIVNNGEDSAEFDRIAARFVLGALVPLALGLGGECFVFLLRAFGDTRLAIVAGAATTVSLLAAWFLLPVMIRAQRPSRPRLASAGE